MSERVRITDVAPRDGLQNEPDRIPTEDKVRLVELLCATGVDEIEVSSFVSPKWVPQLADAAEVFEAAVLFKPPQVVYSALVPNERGMRAALAVNQRSLGEVGVRAVDKVAVFAAASESFSQRNTNASIDDTIERFVPVVEAARSEGLAVRGYVSCAIRCPLEGDIAPEAVARVAGKLGELGLDEIDLGDTIGAGTPESIGAMLRAVIERVGPGRAGAPTLTLHLHDTFGTAAACVATALDLGVRSFDASAGGLGGCPYASTAQQRAPGNLSTRQLVEAVESAGFETGVDLEFLESASRFARSIAGLAQPGGAEDAW